MICDDIIKKSSSIAWLQMERTKKSKLLINFFLSLVLIVLCYEMGQWIIPFFIAIILAYSFHVPLKKLSKTLHISTTFSAAIIVLGIVFVVSLFAIFLIPLLKNAAIFIMQSLPGLLKSLPAYINNHLNGLALSVGIDKTFDVGTVFDKYLIELASNLPRHIPTFIDTGMTFVYIIMFVFMTPIITFYLLKDWQKVEDSFDTVLKKFASPTFIETIKKVNSKLGKYIRGQLIVCLILASAYTIGLWVIGADRYIVCGITSGVLSIAPFFGPLIGLLTTLATSLENYSSSYLYVITIALYIVIPFLDSNFITPKFIGKSTGIQPAWLLFSICACVSILGTIGIFISVPMAVILSTICKEFVKKL